MSSMLKNGVNQENVFELTDFGNSKKKSDREIFSRGGTGGYVAPEIEMQYDLANEGFLLEPGHVVHSDHGS